MDTRNGYLCEFRTKSYTLEDGTFAFVEEYMVLNMCHELLEFNEWVLKFDN